VYATSKLKNNNNKGVVGFTMSIILFGKPYQISRDMSFPNKWEGSHKNKGRRHLLLSA
jgi:hypothetical protein